MTVRDAVTDPDGRRVELTDERWAHIVERHPEIGGHDGEVLRAVHEPDRHMPGDLGNEAWYYLKTEAPSNWLKVVVAYAEGRGYIVTHGARKEIDAMTITIGHFVFDNVFYDSDVDVLYLHMGDPSSAVDFDESPEGHALRFDADGNLLGVTVLGAKRLLARDGELTITVPEVMHVGSDAVAPALVAA